MANDNPSSKYPLTDSIITCGVTVFARAICRMNITAIKSKKHMLARKETVLRIDRFNNVDSHSIITTLIATVKILVRFFLMASAESRKINVKKKLNKPRCHSIGKNGIKNIVKIKSSNRTVLLAVNDLLDTSVKNFILTFLLWN